MAKEILKLFRVFGLILMTYSINAQGLDHGLWDSLLQRHVSENGRVDYLGFKTDSVELSQYLNALEAHLK